MAESKAGAPVNETGAEPAEQPDSDWDFAVFVLLMTLVALSWLCGYWSGGS